MTNVHVFFFLSGNQLNYLARVSKFLFQWINFKWNITRQHVDNLNNDIWYAEI